MTPLALLVMEQQQMQVTMTTATSLSEEYTDTMGNEGPGDGGGTKLKRASSWKKFKDTVKGWVGQPGGDQHPLDPGVPSAVYPTEDVTRATTCVNTVLRTTNCYSGAGGAGGATLSQGSPPYPQAAPDVPSIVVTYDEQRQPSRPPRRSESLRIRPSVSTPDVSNEAEEAAAAAAARILQKQQPPPIAVVAAASPPMKIPVVRIQSEEGEEGEQWVGSIPTPPTLEITQQQPAVGAEMAASAAPTATTTANDEMAKKMAVMKIKQGSIHIR